ncbi:MULTISPECIES: GDSL-type esterase/lipase family protein [Actinosynnema]|uniref:GDSL-type esterase/lipase family protein n=1 Tax=Actinosynnema TaxID=40566 RepID=UPI0020A54CB4|nr:GDSL-type esterase/lipase family protein [Actinosynnema pretiosum]MCP2095026.1 GDSL-like Lipase/Acylhydrolase family protein [Actinosynnema pretiosum]
MLRHHRSALACALLLALTACTGGSDAQDGAGGSATTSSAPPPPQKVYVSVGDSYATGFRPPVNGQRGGSSADAFSHLVAEQAELRLVNLACSGATSADLVGGADCTAGNRALDAPESTGVAQIDAAVAELEASAGQVGLVTVVIGGNDLIPCASGQTDQALACAAQAVTRVKANLATALPKLRAAAGDAPIVGLTYPDVFLGAWVNDAVPGGQRLAELSVSLFRDFFNTSLKAEYDKIGAEFVDVTEATGAYRPLTELVQDPVHGQVPGPVATVCELTYFCELTDVHPKPAGHEVIADGVLAAAGL